MAEEPFGGLGSGGSFGQEQTPFLPQNVPRRSDMWPSPPASPVNCPVEDIQQGGQDIDVEEINPVNPETFDRDGPRIPRKPPPRPPVSKSAAVSPSQQVGYDERPNDIYTSSVENPPPSRNFGFSRQYSADNILQQPSVGRISNNSVPVFGTLGRGPGGFSGGDPRQLGANHNSLPLDVRDNSSWPRQMNPAVMTTFGDRKLLDDTADNLSSEGGTSYCSGGVVQKFCIFYVALLLIIVANMFYWHIWKPDILKLIYLRIFCLFMHTIGFVSTIYLFLSYRALKLKDKFRSRDEQNSNNLLKMSVPVFGFFVLLGLLLRFVLYAVALFDGCLMQVAIPSIDIVVLLLFFLSLIQFLIIYSKSHFSRTNVLPRLALVHVFMGCLSFFGLETVVTSKEQYSLNANFSSNSSTNTSSELVLSSYLVSTEIELSNCSRSLLTNALIHLDRNLYPYLYVALVHFVIVVSAFLVILCSNIKRFKLKASQNFIYGFGQKSKILSCRHNSVGLVCGCTICSFTVSLLMFTLAFKTSVDPDYAAMFGVHNIYTSVIVVMLCLSLCKCWPDLRRHDSKSWSHCRVDKPLLIFSLIFVFLYELGAIYAAIGRFYLDIDPPVSDFVFVVTLIASVLNTFQCIIQAVFLFDALCRVPNRQLPGRSSSRGSVLSMALLNLSLWLIEIVQFAASNAVHLDAAVSTLSGNSYASAYPAQAVDESVSSAHPSSVVLGRFHLLYPVRRDSFWWTFTMFLCSAFAVFYRFHATSCLLNVVQYSYD